MRVTMCDTYREREVGRRMRLLALEDEIVWLDTLEFDSEPETVAPIDLPALPLSDEKKRGPRALTR